MKLTSIGLVVILLCSFCLISDATDYKKEAYTTASKPQLPLDELDLINFILAGTNLGAEIKGAKDSSDTILFSGKNHDTNGNIIPGGKYAIGCNIGQGSLNISNVTLEGTNGTIEDNVSYTLSMNTLTPFLRKNADTTITEDTILQNTTLGSSSNYKIVYVNNSKLTLSTGFTGYGILYIEDKDHNENEYILEMLNNAVWYGVIIVNQTGEDKKSKIFLNGTSEESTDVGDFSILGINYLTFGSNAHVNSGNIGVSSKTGSIVIGNNNRFNDSLFANTIVIGNNCKIDGDVHYNTFIYGHNLNLKGEKKTPLSFPYLNLPEFPVFDIGSQSISRNNNVTYTLNPGSYKNLTFKNNCTLILTGGEYNINKLTMGNNCKIKYMSASTVRIKKKLKIGNNSQIIPHTHHGGIISPFMLIAPPPVSPHGGGGADADDCIFYIQGDYNKNTDVFKAGSNAVLYCNVYAPNTYSVIKLGNNANCKGSFIGNNIIAGNNITAVLKSAFSGNGVGSEAQKVKIYGSLILRGNKFYIPTEGANISCYYCRKVLENVNSELESRPYNIWFNWKETK